MPTKQLEILVTARDQASATFKEVGDSAEGAGGKLGALNSLAETGHGLHKMLRTARNISIAFELLPVGVDALKAAFASIKGTAEDAAEAQEKLLDGIREIPLVGRPAAEAAKFLGDAIANALGNETTDEIIAHMKEVQKTQEEFVRGSEKFGQELKRLQDEAELAGKSGAEREAIERKQQHQKQLDELAEFKKKILAMSGTISDDQEKLADLHPGPSRTRAVTKTKTGVHFGQYYDVAESDEVKAARAKLASDQNELAKARDNVQKFEDAQAKITAAGGKGGGVPEWLKKLGEVGKAAWDKLKDAAREYSERQDKLKEEGMRLWEQSLPPLQKYQDELKHAIELLKEGAISQRQFEDIQHAHDQKTKEHSEGVDRDLMREKIDMLRQEGDLGDKAASREAEKLEIQQRYNDERKKLLAILNDQQATESQKSQAKDLLSHLDSDESKAEAGAGKGKEGPAQLAQLEVSQFLTGVSAKAEQEKGDPELDESKKQTGLLATIAANLGNMLQGKNAIPTKVSFGG